jgi:hypothetical protein
MRLPVLLAALLAGLMAGCAHHPQPSAAAVDTPQYNALYSKPLTSLGAKYAQLTPAAQTTVLAEVGSAQIYDVVKEQRDGRVYYVVTFRDASTFPPLYIAQDGSVLKPDLSVLLAAPKEVGGNASSLISTNDLSPEALKALHERAPGAEVASINKQIWGDHTIYVVTFKDEAHHPKLHLTPEGVVVYTAPRQ